LPVFSGTLVVLAPFIPLAFWPGVIGKFMMYLPITLIIALLASLVVAYIINPVFAADFMAPHDNEHEKKASFDRSVKRTSIVFAILSVLGYLINFGLGNLFVLVYLLYLLHHFVLAGVITRFQTNTWPRVQRSYKSLVEWCLHRYRPVWIVVSIVFLF